MFRYCGSNQSKKAALKKLYNKYKYKSVAELPYCESPQRGGARDQRGPKPQAVASPIPHAKLIRRKF